MGTSKTYGGPGDTRRLLPAWAVPSEVPADGSPSDADEQEPIEGDSDDSPDMPPADHPTGPDGPEPNDGHPDDSPDTPSSNMPPPVGGNHQPWKAAKGSLGRALRSAGGDRNYRKAAKAYVKAHGGSRRAAQTATAARLGTARLASFLSTLATTGASAAAKAYGLASLVGKTHSEVFAAIIDAVAPPGATLEDSAARIAISSTLAELCEKWDVADGGFERLQAMAPDDVRHTIIESVAASIFFRWALQLGLAIETKAVSTSEAIAMEGEMRQYIRDTLKLDVAHVDVLSMDWTGEQGQQIIDKVYGDAYALIETAK